MEAQKWEDLETDCLVNILERVGMESLLLDVPFVCKSWYKASLNPSCWQCLTFSDIDPDYRWFSNSFEHRLVEKYKIKPDRSQHPESSEGGLMGKTKGFSITAFIKAIVNRSSKTATVVILPSSTTEEALKYVADECPSLKTLGLPSEVSYGQQSIIPELIGKWKNLQALMLETSHNLKEILSQISLHCKNFEVLSVDHSGITEEQASAIVTSVPNIKKLLLKDVYINRKSLVIIIEGCKELTHLDVSNCVGLKVDDEILKLASHVHTFRCEGSRAYDSDYDSEYDSDGPLNLLWDYGRSGFYDYSYDYEDYYDTIYDDELHYYHDSDGYYSP